MQPPQTNAQAPVNSESQKPLTSENNPPPLEKVPVHASTPWPEARKMCGNLFELRKDWPIHPVNNIMTATDPKLQVKIEPQDPDQQNPSATTPKPEQCRWRPNCPICNNAEEDWDSKHQKQLKQPDKNAQTNTQQKFPFQTQDMRQAQVQSSQCIQDFKVPQNPQPTQTQSFNVPDHYAEQIRLRREWEEKMEELNEKYRLDCLLDSESDEGENYRYERKYETLI